MKISTLILFCSFLISSTSLLARPIGSIFSVTEDSLFAEVQGSSADYAKSPKVDFPGVPHCETASLAPTVVVTGDFCGQGSGSIDITPDPNTPGPWTYSWSNGATTEDLSGLMAGTYLVNITDANGDVQIAQAVVTDLPPVSPAAANSLANGNTNCFAPYNGSLDLTVIPISPIWTYLWSTGATTQDISGLNSGVYTVSITVGVTCVTPFQFTVPDNAGSPVISLPPPTGGITDTHCEMADGASGVVVTGGATPYTYIWSNGGTNVYINNVLAGTYTITVTGSNGCSDVQTVTINNVNWPITIDYTAITIVPNTTCIGGNGSINIPTVFPLIQGPFSYLWSTGATTETLPNLTSGVYNVTISLNAACFVADGFYVPDAPVVPTLSTYTTPTTCGFSNGFVNLTPVFGGVPPFTYEWSNGETTQDLFNVPAGSYDVTVTGLNGCTVETYADVTDNPILFNYSGFVTDNSACDTTNGQINLSLFPSTLAYQWSNGATTKILKNLAPGSYTVTISAGGTCTAVATYEVGDIREYPNIPAVPTPSTCGLSNGSIDLLVLGLATTPISYNWSNGATTQDLAGIKADTFSVTVTSAVGCSNQNTIIVPNVNDTIRVQEHLADDISCASNTGYIALGITPLDTSYTFLWSNGMTTDSLFNLSAGDYLVTVTLGLSCIALDTFTVANTALPPNLATFGSPTNCDFSNGAVDLSVIGGTGPFNYLWSSAATTEDLDNLPPGAYSVTVTGANSCSAVSAATVLNNNVPLSVSGTPVDNSSCAAPNGALNISVIPAGTYNYLWSNAATSQDLNNLFPGTYTVTVSLGTCLSSSVFTVLDIALPPNLSASGIPATCDFSNGAANLSVSGGTGPFSFLWSNATTTEDLTALAPGNYSVTTTGANSCTAVSSVTILSNNIALNLNGTTQSNSSCTASNGSLDLTVTPAGAYNYQWSNTSNTQDLINLSSGNYTVTVSLGSCQSSSTFMVADITSTPLLSNSITASICGANNGGIDLSVSGPAGPYSYFWSNAATTQDLSNLLPGNYTVTVTAANGCTQSATLNVPNNASNFSLAAAPVPLTDCATNNGAIDLNITPAGAYVYLWSNTATTQDLNGLPPGTYTVSVTESGSCTATASYFVIDQRSSPISSQAIVPELCGLSNGSIDLNVSGGNGPYLYQWASGQASQDLSNIPAGNYTVTVTDFNHCTVTANAIVPGNSIAFALAGVPGSNSSCLQNNGSIDLSVNPPGGVTYLWSNLFTAQDLNGLNAGTYTVTVSAGGNCIHTAAFTIINDLPSPLVSQNITAATCGQAGGAIDMSVSGSPTPYQFNWSNAVVTEDLSGIISGNYTVTVTAANGCTSVGNFVVPENSFVPNIGSVSTQSTSCLVNNGAIDLSINPPFVPGYTFLWSNAATTEDLANIAAGTYTVTVNGGGACTNTAVISVGSSIPLPILSNNIAAATCGQASGSIDLSVAGSVGPYQFLWSNTATTEDLLNSLAGTFTVTVTAANSCTTVGNFTIPENVVLPVILGIPMPDNSCILNNGAVNLSVGPATSYSFLWSNAATTEDLANLPAGTYTVFVNGGGACTGMASFTVTDQSTQPQASITSSATALDCSTTATTLNGNLTGTPNPTSFQWTGNGIPLGSNTSLPATAPGLYDLVVTDNVTACTASASITVTQNLNPPPLSVANPGILTCNAPMQTLSGSSTLGGVQFAWATILGTDTTLLGNGATLLVSAPGTYFLIGLNPANQCFNTTSVSVPSDQVPPIANAGTSFTLDCAGETAPLSGSGSGGPNLSYQWTSPNGHFVAGAGSASPLIDKAGTYVLEVSNLVNGCTDTDAVTILPEIPVAYASVIQPICQDEQGTVRIDTVTGLSAPFLFSLNNSIPGIQQQFEHLMPGSYTIQVSGGNGCSALATVTVDAPTPLAISLSPIATITQGYSYLTDAAVNIPSADIASVSWTPSTGLDCDTCLITTATPLTTTSYQVLLRSKAGCEVRGSLRLIVDRSRKIYAPNIFSPNEDGKNDIFTIFADPLTVVKIKTLQVYSRWGEQVFEVTDFAAGDLNMGWDGTFKGEKLNPSVFVWQAVILFVDGKEEVFTGDVTLLR